MERRGRGYWFILWGLLGLLLVTGCAGGKKAAKVLEAQPAGQEASTGRAGLPTVDGVVGQAIAKSRGFINAYVVRKDRSNHYYFEIPFSVLGRDLLIVNKVTGVSGALNETGLNKGTNYRNLLVRFVHDAANGSCQLVEVHPIVKTRPGDAIQASVARNYIPLPLENFPVRAYNADSTSLLIEVGALFNGESTTIQNLFDVTGLGTSPLTKLSGIVSMEAFPTNVLVKSRLVSSNPGATEHTTVAVGVASNFVLLPERPMVARFSDERLGFFHSEVICYADDQQEVVRRDVLERWRIEPRPEDRAAYFAGQLVEPAQPIIFYIDSATPAQWVPYIRQGIEAWQGPFERIGFKNAIQARKFPRGDSAFDMDDARYNTVTYAASEVSNAMGPSVVDPRSGEVIGSDVMWWHNVMKAIRHWMRLQTGLYQPGARANKVDEQLMGQAIAYVACHEIGHTLGLMHNMAGSYAYSVDSLRNPQFAKQYGTASSIMDYARFNYVAQAGDGVRDFGAKLGPYDYYAIEYGYRYTGAQSPFEELKRNDSLIAAHRGDPRYFFGPQADARTLVDPRAQSEDVGNNAMEASRLGIKNLKALMPHVLEWTQADDGHWVEAGKFLYDIMDQWQNYSYHVLANVGGVYLQDPHYCGTQPSFVPVPKALQADAVKFLCQEVLTYPAWLFSGDIYRRIYPVRQSPDGPYEYAPMELYKNYQGYVLWDMLDDERLARMLENEAQNGDGAYTVSNMLDDIFATLFAPTRRGAPLTVYERIAQKGYIDALIIAADRGVARKEKKSIVDYYGPMPNLACDDRCAQMVGRGITTATRRIKYNQLTRVGDQLSLKRAELQRIAALFKQRLNTGDRATKAHYHDMMYRIADALGE